MNDWCRPAGGTKVAPDAPTNVRVYNVTERSVTLTWHHESPSELGHEIIAYSIHYDLVAGKLPIHRFSAIIR